MPPLIIRRRRVHTGANDRTRSDGFAKFEPRATPIATAERQASVQESASPNNSSPSGEPATGMDTASGPLYALLLALQHPSGQKMLPSRRPVSSPLHRASRSVSPGASRADGESPDSERHAPYPPELPAKEVGAILWSLRKPQQSPSPRLCSHLCCRGPPGTSFLPLGGFPPTSSFLGYVVLLRKCLALFFIPLTRSSSFGTWSRSTEPNHRLYTMTFEKIADFLDHPLRSGVDIRSSS